MTLSLIAVCLSLVSLTQLADSPVELAPRPTVVQPVPPDDEYIEITRAGVPVAPAVYYAPVNPPRDYQPVQQVSAMTTWREPVVARRIAQAAPATPADIQPTLTGPGAAPANAIPFAPNQAVPTNQSLFTNGYGGTRAYAVAAPAAGSAPVPYQPISSLGPAPVIAQPVMPVPNYHVGRGIIGQPKLYVPQQPVRNFLRWLTP